ncbi:helicase associated domain-containing protein [Streptomyces sp. enrichment culture]|uniref:helicase associated domain-containing protein n=1 Tax=Streptomyces sp. enrichment culture TaxID=1795815 RepID=UPI003F568F96
MPHLRPAPPRPAPPPRRHRHHRPDGPRTPGTSRSGQGLKKSRHACRAQAHPPAPRRVRKTATNTTGTPSQSADKPRRPARAQPAPKAPRSRLGHRPDLVPGFERALEQARAYAAEHGHLAAPRAARPNGYPLGAWLFSQRNRAKQRARDGLPPLSSSRSCNGAAGLRARHDWVPLSNG